MISGWVKRVPVPCFAWIGEFNRDGVFLNYGAHTIYAETTHHELVTDNTRGTFIKLPDYIRQDSRMWFKVISVPGEPSDQDIAISSTEDSPKYIRGQWLSSGGRSVCCAGYREDGSMITVPFPVDYEE